MIHLLALVLAAKKTKARKKVKPDIMTSLIMQIIGANTKKHPALKILKYLLTP